MGEWDWELTDTSRRDFGDLDDHARDRIASKLDEIVTDDWRNPPEHLEPLQGDRTRNSVLGRSDSVVGQTVANRSSTSSGFGNAVMMPTGVTTINQDKHLPLFLLTG